MPTPEKKPAKCNARVEEQSENFYREHFKSMNAGAEWSVNAMPRLAKARLVQEIVQIDRSPYEIEGALMWAAEAVPRLVAHTLAYELRGKFTRGELSMILDVLNGHGMQMRMSPHTPGQYIGLSIADSFELYPGSYEAKWGVDKKHMMDTLAETTLFQRAALEYWAAMFWEGDFNGENALENHCAILEATE